MHYSVLLDKAVEGLAIKPDGIYVDGTFGRGGHSSAVLKQLSPEGRLIGIDKDPEAVRYAQELFADDRRFKMVHGSFADLEHIAKEETIAGKINGILLDLGVSSPQIDSPTRGFSFIQEGPLDMRMNTEQQFSAADFIATASEKEMATVFREYGEERFAVRIARAIVAARQQSTITTTQKLAEIVKEANPKWEKHKHPATRVFQAIRIHVNEELKDLAVGLEASYKLLAKDGRLVVISFHSLEDRLVKQFMKKKEEGNKPPLGVPMKEVEIKKTFRRIGKAIKPEQTEISENIRSRSAVLRIGEKLL